MNAQGGINMANVAQQWAERLEACETVEELAAWAEALYDSGDLDESEQIFDLAGPLAPWSVPDGTEELWSNGEDMIVRLQSGALARWTNSERAWSDGDVGELAEHLLHGVDDPVLVERMPAHLRESHRAARNWGVYPANGAERVVMDRADAEALCDGDEYDRIVRDARPRDVLEYAVEVAS